MYNDEDLDNAVEAGIFSAQSVQQFRNHIAQNNNSVAVDEENFRLVSSFNDIYVVIACLLMLVSLGWFASSISDLVASTCFAITSWLLAEYFVLKRHMALPAIVLLVSFLLGVLGTSMAFLNEMPIQPRLLLTGVITAIAAWLHWRRFQVPITIAGGTAAAIGCVVAVTLSNTESDLAFWFAPLMLTSGIASFCFAMYWDRKDTQRTTRHSDVAFWLHLLSAPLIVHPIFSLLGILEGNITLSAAIIVIAMYMSMAVVSVAIDRRAILVSGLAYVLYTISSLLDTFGLAASSSAITGIVIGAALLMLSVYWQTSRAALFKMMPDNLKATLPPLK